MAKLIRQFATTAMQAMVERKTWKVPGDFEVGYYDKTHYQIHGQKHLNRVIAYIKRDLNMLNVDYLEAMGVPHPHNPEKHMTVRLYAKEVLKCVCHFFVDGRVTWRKDGKKSDDLPTDIEDRWIAREDAEEAAKAAKAAASEGSGSAPN